MSQFDKNPFGEGDQPQQPGGQGPGNIEQIRHRQISARVPEHVARGVFSTGAIVMTGGTEFVLDFVVRMARPHQVAARVVMPHGVMPRFIEALRQNIDKYRERFGEPPRLPDMPQPQPGEHRPSIQEVYDELKMPDEALSGAYANGVMISHTPSEFGFDFVTNFFPQSSVSCRVYLSAAQAPKLLESIQNSYEQFKKRVIEQQQQLRQQQMGGSSQTNTFGPMAQPGGPLPGAADPNKPGQNPGPGKGPNDPNNPPQPT